MENWLDISNYDERRTKKLLPVGKNNKVIGLMKDETGGKIIIIFLAFLQQNHMAIEYEKMIMK